MEHNPLCSVTLAVCCGSQKLDSGSQCLQTGPGRAVSLSASPPAVALQVAWQGSGGNEKFFFENENVSRMGQNAPCEWCVKLCVHQQEKCHLRFWKTLFLSSFLDLASSCRSQSASSLYLPFPHARYSTNSVRGLTS